MYSAGFFEGRRLPTIIILCSAPDICNAAAFTSIYFIYSAVCFEYHCLYFNHFSYIQHGMFSMPPPSYNPFLYIAQNVSNAAFILIIFISSTGYFQCRRLHTIQFRPLRVLLRMLRNRNEIFWGRVSAAAVPRSLCAVRK